MLTLRQLRQRSGFSQEAVAEFIGVKQRTVSQWERFKAVPTIIEAVLLARCYGVTLDDIALAFGVTVYGSFNVLQG